MSALFVGCGDNSNAGKTGDDDDDGGGGTKTEDCSTPGDEDGNGLADCLDPACVNEPSCQMSNPQLCGNHTLDTGEACDDGNTIDGDGCDSNCTATACGNGITTNGEACDDGNLTDGDGCDRNCTPTGCGNGIQTGDEACDDGNTVNGDGCDNNCKPTGCGNGVKAGTEECDDGNTTNGDGCDNNCTASRCGNGIVAGTEVCDDGNAANWDGCGNTCVASAYTYVKASNTNAGDNAGAAVALSADGLTLAVGAELESSAATGIGGNAGDNSKKSAGAVYVFVKTGGVWAQQAYIKASNTDANDHFGGSLSLSADGATLAVGAFGEASSDAADPTSNAAAGAGAVYVFGASNGAWSQKKYLKASTIAAGDNFGKSVALSGDGKRLAVGDLGAETAYVFARTGDDWAVQGSVTSGTSSTTDNFGQSVALSTDGTTLVVGAPHEDGTATGAGGAYVFARSGDTWAAQGHLTASDAVAAASFGSVVSVSGDGATAAVGAFSVVSNMTTTGEAYVFSRTGATWTQAAALRAVKARGNVFFGASVSLSSDGQRLAVGAWGESSGATLVGGDETRLDVGFSGAAYLFVRGDTWTQQSYVKASNTGMNDFFGWSVSLSHDGGTLAVGAPFESGASNGINGDQASNAASSAGAAYLYE